jgi:hypothetical protein
VSPDPTLALTLILALLLILRRRHAPPGPIPMPDPAPGPTHMLTESIAAKKAADAAVAAANEALGLDMATSGPVYLGDAARPGTFEVWHVDATTGIPESFVVSDANGTVVPGPSPPPAILSLTAADMAALAAIRGMIDGIAAGPGSPPPPTS